MGFKFILFEPGIFLSEVAYSYLHCWTNWRV